LPVATGISLTPIRLCDADALASLIAGNVRHLRTYMPKVIGLGTPDSARGYLQAALDAHASGTLFEWHIFDGNRLCGAIRLNHLELDSHKASVGYYIGAEHQGRGLATLSVGAVVQFAFERLHLNRIELRCASDNVASQRVAERLGFRWEGLLRQAELVEGAYLDHFVYGLLAADDAGSAGMRQAA